MNMSPALAETIHHDGPTANPQRSAAVIVNTVDKQDAGATIRPTSKTGKKTSFGARCSGSTDYRNRKGR